MKILTTLLFGLVFLDSFSQVDKEKIRAHFDYLDYYPDSTIRSAHKYTGVSLERFTVEFSAAGAPVAMGTTKKGVKTGKWIYSDGSADMFDEKFPGSKNPYGYNSPTASSGSTMPGCGTGILEAKLAFMENYQKRINPKAENDR